MDIGYLDIAMNWGHFVTRVRCEVLRQGLHELISSICEELEEACYDAISGDGTSDRPSGQLLEPVKERDTTNSSSKFHIRDKLATRQTSRREIQIQCCPGDRHFGAIAILVNWPQSVVFNTCNPPNLRRLLKQKHVVLFFY